MKPSESASLTKLQAADILTKGKIATTQWKALCRLSNTMQDLLKEKPNEKGQADLRKLVEKLKKKTCHERYQEKARWNKPK